MSAAIFSLLAAQAKTKTETPSMRGYDSYATFEDGFYTLRSIDHVTGVERVLAAPARMTKAEAKRQARVDRVSLYFEQEPGAVSRALYASWAANGR